MTAPHRIGDPGHVDAHNAAQRSLDELAAAVQQRVPSSLVGAPSGVAKLDDAGRLVAGQAPLNLLTAADASAAYARSGLGTFVPAGWGANWRAKRNAAGASKAVLACVGDSITQGFFASGLSTKGWAGLVRADLQATYGDGGSGISTAAMSKAYLTQVVSAGVLTAYAAQLWGQSGVWSSNTVANSIDGPGGTIAFSSAAGGTQTVVGRGTTIKLHYLTAPANGALTYAIDGGAPVTVDTAVANGIGTTTISGLAAGTHTVVLTTSSAAGVALCAVSFENDSGVVVDNYGAATYRADNFGKTTSIFGQPRDWSGGNLRPADLVIYGVGVNDANVNTAPDTYLASVQSYLSGVRDRGAANDGSTDILLLMPHVGTWEGTSRNYAAYALRMRTLAEIYGAAFVNEWTIGRNSWQRWKNQSLWGIGTGASGASGSDPVHPSDAGHAQIASTVLAILKS